MTPINALKVLSAVTARMTGTRQEHSQVLDALETVRLSIPEDRLTNEIDIRPLQRDPPLIKHDETAH